MIAWHHKVTEGSDNLFWHFQHFLVNGSQFQIRSFCDYFTHKDTIISASRNTPIDVTNLYISYQVWLDKMEDHSNLLHNIATLSTDDQQLGKKNCFSNKVHTCFTSRFTRFRHLRAIHQAVGRGLLPWCFRNVHRKMMKIWNVRVSFVFFVFPLIFATFFNEELKNLPTRYSSLYFCMISWGSIATCCNSDDTMIPFQCELLEF